MANSLLKRLDKRSSHRNYFKIFPDESQIDGALLQRLQLEQELEGHTGCVNCLDWNSSGTLLASGSDDLKVILWNPFTYKSCCTIATGHRGNIFSVKFFPETRDRIVASGAGDHQVYIHDVTYKEKIHGFLCNARVKRLVSSAAAPHNLWCASEDGMVREFDIREPPSSCSKVLIDLTLMCGDTAECKCLAINPTRPHLLGVGANDPYVRLYDRRMLKEAATRPTNGQKRKDNAHFTCSGCVSYFIPGHLQHKVKEYRRRMRNLCTTYLTFNSRGNECLVNVGGEQVYLYNIDSKMESLLKPAWSNPAKKSMNGLSIHPEEASSFSTSGPLLNDVMKETGSSLPRDIESLKIIANDLFAKRQFTSAVVEYNKAIMKAPKSAVLLGNRAAAYMKRNWDGDTYAALRDCREALHLNPEYTKANFRLIRCLYELRQLEEAKHFIEKFKRDHPEEAKSRSCLALENDIKIALQAPDRANLDEPSVEQEVKFQNTALDYLKRYCGHCNTTTDIKEANFLGNDGQFITAGSDDGSFFVWERNSCNLVRVMRADDSIVNCLQPHPFVCMLATSGIDHPVRLWSPRDGGVSDRAVKETQSAAAANQERMNTDPFESMLLTMGVRTQRDPDGDGEVTSCRTS